MASTPIRPEKQVKRHPVRYVRVAADQAGRRIDNYLSAELRDVPRPRIYQMLRRGEVRVDGKRVKQGFRLEPGQEIRIPPVTVDPEPPAAAPRAYLLDMIRNSVVYEDQNLLVLNKPAGLVVHGGSGRTYGVIELLRYVHGDQAAGLHLAHRLDRETSGLLLLARNLRYLTALQECFREGRIGKLYQALLKGKPAQPVTTVDIPLERNVVRSGERLSGVSEHGKRASTRFKLVRVIKEACLVDVEIATGRTHQIRVHAASIGHPVAGDDKYGDRSFNKRMKRAGLKRLFLHAGAIRIPALAGGKALRITAPLPEELAVFLRDYGRPDDR
jgi:23S rRNA pseudouridine955/2504/2580 synthase